MHAESDIETGSTAPSDGRRSLGQSTPLILLAVACLGLVTGGASWWWGDGTVATWVWAAATAPVIAALAVSIARQMIDGRFGVDAIAFVSMSAALLLGQPLAGIVVAIMYSGGTALEEMAIDRAKRDLKHLVDRAPRFAYRMIESNVVKVPVEQVLPGDRLFVRACEIGPVDGVVETATAFLDESALTGEPRPLHRSTGDVVRSGAVNAGDAFAMQARARATESAYAAIVRMVEAAQAAKTPFIRMADRFAVVLFPLTIAVAGFAWWWSGEPLRGLSVMVVATPCPSFSQPPSLLSPASPRRLGAASS